MFFIWAASRIWHRKYQEICRCRSTDFFERYFPKKKVAHRVCPIFKKDQLLKKTKLKKLLEPKVRVSSSWKFREQKSRKISQKSGNFSKQNQWKSIFTIFEILNLHWLSIEKNPDFDRFFCSQKFQLEDALTFDSNKIFELGLFKKSRQPM